MKIWLRGEGTEEGRERRGGTEDGDKEREDNVIFSLTLAAQLRVQAVQEWPEVCTTDSLQSQI